MADFKKVLLKIKSNKFNLIFASTIGVIIVVSAVLLCLSYSVYKDEKAKNSVLSDKLFKTQNTLTALQNQDQVKINQDLKKEIDNINKTYKKTSSIYEEITDIDAQKGKTDDLKKQYAQILVYLSERNYASADASLTVLKTGADKEKDRIATLATPGGATLSTANLPTSNTPPGAGYSRQVVSALGSTYVVDIVAADMGSTRVIVDTASDGDCHDNCPVLSLGDYVARSGAFAGVNGSYFCPADYPTCAGKSNSFDTLAMNKNKHYLNSDNNVYSTVPAVIFQPGSMRYVGASQEWGRDTSVDGVLANQPLLLSGGEVRFGGGSDPKQGSKGNRSFVGNKGNIAYIGVVHNVTVAEMAQVLKAMGLDGALNLDSGGSTALWSGGYKAGPGRAIPNAVLFVRK
ncbi:MAG TPA: phosphodiester glycosidase family protein [Patescibacteria group bacterium]|nr:phosphodiester glycosidase family protein [Patescibacteria group bacterium]